ncbi:hypothetical protein CUU66_17335 [Peribacillus deserti]|uniref:Peptidoglycan binding domain-containing protein n=1 Tax=Peribacillus deserti TaxID=673318 RepID=A0A2N5M2U5_9BACI|nr:hypothetical protein CUU66_17335 [Peribacillus deserti]
MKLMGIAAVMMFINPGSQYHLTLKHGQTEAVIERADITDDFPGFDLIDLDKLSLLIEEFDSKFYIPAKNAIVNEHGGIEPEKVGWQIDRQKLIELMYTFFYSNHSLTNSVPVLPIYPKVDSELLSEINARQIGRYATFFNSINQARTHNMTLAVKAIDNVVVFPGESFSFNKVVGKRTASKGYMRAPVIVKGELAEDIGGGICQVSSTLFNAVDHTGVQIVERFSHSRKVPYVPPGRDATVSWYGPDFVFKNNLNQPILIKAKISNGNVLVRIYSSESVISENNP